MSPRKIIAADLSYENDGKTWHRLVITAPNLPHDVIQTRLALGSSPQLTPLSSKLEAVEELAEQLGDKGEIAFGPPLLAFVRDSDLTAPFKSQTLMMKPLDGSTDDAVPPELAPLLFQPGRATYALLDGALIMGLPERLAASGLRYACLYEGAAAQEFADTAPYIAELTAKATLTKSLFSHYAKDGIQRGLWPSEASVIVQSPASLNALKSHFRKFIYVQDEQGKRVFFRFYVPTTLRTLIAHMALDDLAKFGQGVELFLGRAAPFGALVLARD